MIPNFGKHILSNEIRKYNALSPGITLGNGIAFRFMRSLKNNQCNIVLNVNSRLIHTTKVSRRLF